MQRYIFTAAVVFWSLSLYSDSNVSIFGGGPLYHDAERVVPLVKNSGFKTVILWTLHIRQNGDFVFNDDTIIQDGQYVGRPEWPAQIAELKSKDSSVTRMEFSVGSWGVTDFETIAFLIEKQGTGPASVLYRNFAVLKRVLPSLDAINFDDESNYELKPSFLFSLMLYQIGYQISLSPFTRIDFWSDLFLAVNSVVPGLIDAVYLQGYAGGSGANPAVWNRFFPKLKVQLGLWGQHGPGCQFGQSPRQMATHFSLHKRNLSGAWVWLLDDLLECDSYALADYVGAIVGALSFPDSDEES